MIKHNDYSLFSIKEILAMFSKALLEATYKNGRPGKPTEAHEQAEHHRFKTEFLFKNKAISKEIYASRLIQHF